MFSSKKAVPTTSTNIKDVFGFDDDRFSGLVLQAPSTNTNSVFIGEVELTPGKSITFPKIISRDLFVVGSSGDYIAILAF